MSERYPGGIISKTPVTPSGPYANSTAPGVWTLDQQLQFQQAGNWPTQGNVDPNLFIENLFSTYLYTGNASTQAINNGIDLSTKGGLVWAKSRSNVASHALFDTVRGGSSLLVSDTTAAAYTGSTYIDPFSTNGFTWAIGDNQVNQSGRTYVSWTFRKQAKFFDVVTWTGDGSASRSISHNLGSVPGCIIVKCTSNATNWPVYHSGLNNGVNPQDYAIYLNLTNDGTGGGRWGGVAPTSTTFNVNNDNSVNTNSYTYVAYLFASNAGGFGNAGTDNVITCGSFTTDGSGNATVSLGYEPQWLLFKPSSGGGTNWRMIDVMRGFTAGATDAVLVPNTTGAEISVANGIGVTSTGFTGGSNFFDPSTDVIYIAIRRGPMATPTDATKVFLPNNGASSTSGQAIATTFPVDLIMSAYQTQGYVGLSNDRLRGISNTNTAGTTPALQTSTSSAESAFSGSNPWFINAWNKSITRGSNGADPVGGIVSWLFGRAPGFFDEVCYTGTGSATTQTHNLGVVPELMIIKSRTQASDWQVYSAALANTQYLLLSYDFAVRTGTDRWNSTTPTSSVFSIGSSGGVNGSAETYVAYLFATVAGVSKVGSYTGNGTTQTINCGFGAGGVRFVLIKRTDSTGNWYVYDTARGMTTLTDPYLLLNSTAAETATLGSVTTVSTGFALNSSILAAINVNAGTYIFLAIA